MFFIHYAHTVTYYTWSFTYGGVYSYRSFNLHLCKSNSTRIVQIEIGNGLIVGGEKYNFTVPTRRPPVKPKQSKPQPFGFFPPVPADVSGGPRRKAAVRPGRELRGSV